MCGGRWKLTGWSRTTTLMSHTYITYSLNRAVTQQERCTKGSFVSKKSTARLMPWLFSRLAVCSGGNFGPGEADSPWMVGVCSGWNFAPVGADSPWRVGVCSGWNLAPGREKSPPVGWSLLRNLLLVEQSPPGV